LGTGTHEGPEVILRASFAGREHQWLGRIVRTEGEIDARSRMVHVIAQVQDPYGTADSSLSTDGVGSLGERPPLAVGLFVRAEIAGPVAKGVIAIPRSAIRNDQRILVVDRENRLRKRAVEIIRIDRDEVLIRTQLAEGERICTSPLQVAVEGMQVEPVMARVERGS